MTTLADMLEDLRDRLNDAGDTQVPKPAKVRYLNHGIRATWPRLYRTERDSTIVLAPDTFEYSIPSAVGSNARFLRVEVETGIATNRFRPLFDHEIVRGLTDPILLLDGTTLPSVDGARIRITSAKQLTELVTDGDVYDGPAGTEELPVLYAMGLSSARRLDDRIDHRRYSTTAVNGVDADQIMTVSQFNFAQFELLLERFAMPLPAEQG